MKKRFSSLLLALLLTLCLLPAIASADGELPFTLVPPGNLTVAWLETNDSPTTVNVAYSLSNEMTAFFKQLDDANLNGTADALLAPYGVDSIGITTQIDWAVDDIADPVSGWHHTAFWDGTKGFGLGYDNEGRIRVGEWDGVDIWVNNATETVNTFWYLRGVSEDALNGNPDTLTPGIKDQMHPDQYTYHDDNLYIDFTAHTVYFRMRFVVWTSKDTDEGVAEQFYFSDWSDVAAVGKDAGKTGALTKADVSAPVITGLRLTDKEFNDNPVVAFTLTVPDDLAAKSAQVAAAGGTMMIETEARVKGDAEWTLMSNSDFLVKAGEMECALITLVNDARPVIARDTVIELRCRYYCAQADRDPFWSDYSNVISFGTDDISQGGSSGTGVMPTEEADVCPLCHFCPRPLGLCIFIWLAILLLILVVLLVIVLVVRKRKHR